MNNNLVAIYEKLNLSYIALRRAFMTDDIAPASVLKNYYIVNSMGSVGHLSARGHAKVAELIAEYLKGKQAISLDEAVTPAEKDSHL